MFNCSHILLGTYIHKIWFWYRNIWTNIKRGKFRSINFHPYTFYCCCFYCSYFLLLENFSYYIYFCVTWFVKIPAFHIKWIKALYFNRIKLIFSFPKKSKKKNLENQLIFCYLILKFFEMMKFLYWNKIWDKYLEIL